MTKGALAYSKKLGKSFMNKLTTGIGSWGAKGNTDCNPIQSEAGGDVPFSIYREGIDLGWE